MILKGSRHTHDFLSYPCGDSRFLINRSQFVFSRVLEGERPVKTKIPWIDGLLEHKGENLLCLNLEGYLGELFAAPPSSGTRIALIVPVSEFDENHRVMFKKLTGSAKVPLSEQFLTCKIGNRAEISAIPLSEIRLLPEPVRKYMAGTGFLGVRWIGEGDLQYFVDIETILFHLILGTLRKNQ